MVYEAIDSYFDLQNLQVNFIFITALSSSRHKIQKQFLLKVFRSEKLNRQNIFDTSFNGSLSQIMLN